MRSLVAAIVGLAGCVSLPPAMECHPGALELCGDGVDQDCDGVDLACGAVQPNAWTENGDLWTLRNGAVTLTFNRGAGDTGLVGLATAHGGGTNLLMTSTDAPDRLAAVTRWSDAFSYRASAFDAPVDEPAMTRVDLDWHDADVRGTTTYTIYPDGRILRHEEIEVGVTDPASEYLTSYVAFNAPLIAAVDWDQHGTMPTPIPIPSTSPSSFIEHYRRMNGPSDFMCVLARGGGDGIALAASAPSDLPGLRLTEIVRVPLPPPDEVRGVGFGFDWRQNHVVEMGSYAADLMIHVGPTSGLPCDGMAPFAGAFLHPSPPTVSAPGVPVLGDAEDEGHDGYLERVGAYAVSAGDAPRLSLTMTGAMPSLALRLEHVELARDPVITLDGAVLVHGRDYFLQVDGDRRWAVFVVPFAAGQTLLFEWP